MNSILIRARWPTQAAATLVGLVVLGLALTASAAEAYEQFFGRYEGKAIVDGGGDGATGGAASEDDENLSVRDLTVKIGPSEKGFYVEWVALIPKSGGRTKRVAYKVPFRATRRDGIFASAMKMDMFGHAKPLDPLKGEPYVWARIAGNVLTVHSMLVTDEGGYEMQVHRRELQGEKMALSYSRVRDGEVLRGVSGMLKRVE